MNNHELPLITVIKQSAEEQIDPTAALPEQLLTLDELGFVLHLSGSTIRRYVKRRGLPHYRLPPPQSEYRFKWSEVERWLRGWR